MTEMNEDKEDGLVRHERMLFPVCTHGEQSPRVGMWTCERRTRVGWRWRWRCRLRGLWAGKMKAMKWKDTKK
jgi:hypothetical protein